MRWALKKQQKEAFTELRSIASILVRKTFE